MKRIFLLLIAVGALMGCAATIAPYPGDTRQPANCAGSADGCSVTAHDAAQSVLVGDLNTYIHDYLVTHPKVLLEMQAAYRVEMQKAATETAARFPQTLAEHHDQIYADPTDGILGNPSGDVVIVEWFDDSCPYCHKLAEPLAELVAADHGVKLVFKEFVLPQQGAPLNGPPALGAGSMLAARAAIALQRQGNEIYVRFHAAVMADDKTPEGRLSVQQIEEMARAAGADVERMKRDVEDPQIMKKIERTRQLASDLGIDATPGLIIGGRLAAVRTLADLRQAVAQARANGASAAAASQSHRGIELSIPYATDDGQGNVQFDRPVCARKMSADAWDKGALIKDGVLYARSVRAPVIMHGGPCQPANPGDYVSFEEIRAGKIERGGEVSN